MCGRPSELGARYALEGLRRVESIVLDWEMANEGDIEKLLKSRRFLYGRRALRKSILLNFTRLQFFHLPE